MTPQPIEALGASGVALIEAPAILRSVSVANPSATTLGFLKIYTTEDPDYATEAPAMSFGIPANRSFEIPLHDVFAQYTRVIFTQDRGAGVTAPQSAAIVTLSADPIPPEGDIPGVAELVSLSTGIVFRPSMADLDDTISGEAGTNTNTTYDQDYDARVVASGQYVTWDSAADLAGATPLTVGMWIYQSTWSGAQYLMDIGSSGPPSVRFSITATPARLFFHRDFDTTDLQRAGAGSFLGRRVHVAVTYDGSTNATGARFYTNGIEVATYSLPVNGVGTPRDTLGSWRMGAQTSGSTFSFEGRIEDVRVYNRELTPAEIHNWWASGRRL